MSDARIVTLRLQKGSVRATQAAINKLFDIQLTTWTPLTEEQRTSVRRPYGNRQRSNAAAGKVVSVLFKDGEEWTYRVTGTMKNFLDQLATFGKRNDVANVFTQRGTEYGPVMQVPQF